VDPPDSEAALLGRARAIAGRPLGWLAERTHQPVPPVLTRAKGWVGLLIERSLGASASSRASPDFERLGVELKTLPISRRGLPRESTFVTTLAPRALIEGVWADSPPRKKLARVLWVPVEASPEVPVADRRVGNPLLWSPTADDDRVLAADWMEFQRITAEGWLDALTGHAGEYLQVRPKASDASARRWTPDPDGAEAPALPRGFYLRARFTARILADHYHPASRGS
jgi:DNA mismatch repair protein MutH